MTLQKTYLPDCIIYRGNEYKLSVDKTYLHRDHKLSNKKNCIIVNVLSKNLKGKKDFHGNEYNPTIWVFEKISTSQQKQLS